MAIWTEVVSSIAATFNITIKKHPLRIGMFFLKRLSL
jgi:hypothetical protein